MHRALTFVHVLGASGFAGGCLCISVTLLGLLSLDPATAGGIMQNLLPSMGRLMGPLLLLGVTTGALLAALASFRRGPFVAARFLVLGSFAAIGGITALVHFPINAEFLAGDPIAGDRAAVLLARWLSWHHARTAMAIAALAVLLWPRRSPAYAVAR